VVEAARAKLAAALQAFAEAQSALAVVQSALAAGRALPRGTIMELDKVRSALAEAAEALGLDPEQATLAELQARLATRESTVGLRHALEYLGQATGPAVAAAQLAPLAADAARLATSESWSPEDEARALLLVRLVELADAATGNGDDERILVLDAELRRGLGPAGAAVILAATRGRLALPAHEQRFIAGRPGVGLAEEAVPPSAPASAPLLEGREPARPGRERPPAELPPPAHPTGARLPRAVVAVLVLLLIGLAAAVALIVHDRGAKTTARTAPQSASSQSPSPPAAAGAQPSPLNTGTSLPAASPAPQATPGSAPAPAVDVAAIAAAADPVLVGLTITRADGTLTASGIVLNSSGAVVTNDHVIEHALTITARIASTGATYSGTVVGDNDTVDIALIQLQGASGLQAPKLGDATSLSVGDPVVAVWQAPGQGAPAATTATVTALNQTIPAIDPDAPSKILSGVIQTSAPLPPPASGGPLVNAKGEIEGVCLAPEPFQPQTGTAGYALPINTALAAILDIQQGRSK
jgi:S1-C subfamily serine protease